MDFPTLAVPVPLARVGGLLAVTYPPWFLIIISEFESRLVMVDLAFHHSHNIALGPGLKKRERTRSRVVDSFTALFLNAC